MNSFEKLSLKVEVLDGVLGLPVLSSLKENDSVNGRVVDLVVVGSSLSDRVIDCASVKLREYEKECVFADTVGVKKSATSSNTRG